METIGSSPPAKTLRLVSISVRSFCAQTQRDIVRRITRHASVAGSLGVGRFCLNAEVLLMCIVPAACLP